MMTERQETSPVSHEVPKRQKGIRALVQGVTHAMRRAGDIERVRSNRRGEWQGPPTWVVPGSLSPIDNEGIIDVRRLTDKELRTAVSMGMLSYGVLLAEDQERLLETEEGFDASVLPGLMQKVQEDLQGFSPERPNYS